jgi:hypothetical protein
VQSFFHDNYVLQHSEAKYKNEQILLQFIHIILMSSTLASGGVYKIISVASSRVVTLSSNGSTSTCQNNHSVCRLPD